MSKTAGTERIIKERHFETQRLIDDLATLAPNEVRTYEETAKRCDVSVETVKKRANSAMQVVLKSPHNVIVNTVRGVGFIRVPEEDAPAPMRKQLARASNAAKRSRKIARHGVTNFEALNPEVRSTLYALEAQAGAVIIFASRQSMRKLKEYAEAANNRLDFGRTMELLK